MDGEAEEAALEKATKGGERELRQEARADEEPVHRHDSWTVRVA